MKNLLFLLILFLVYSCKENKSYEELILGDWQLIEEKKASSEEEVNSPFKRILPEISFKKNGVYLNKDGFYDYDDSEKEMGFEKINKTKFLGTNSKYKIVKDSLYLYNLISKKYESSFIVKINKRKLILRNKQGQTLNFNRFTPSNLISDPIFEAIIVTNEACFGTCPIRNVMITKEGNILYYGETYNSINGFFVGKFDKNKFEEYRIRLNVLRVNELENHYSVDATDLPTTNITIIKDGKIYKSISDYGNSSPRELIRIMNEIGYLYQTSKLSPSNFNTIKIRGEFWNDKKLVNLIDSEKFYLQIQLNNSKKNLHKFNTKFFGEGYIEPTKDFDYSNFHLLQRKIETDGRFFKLENKDKNFETYDLGYNFFERNKLIKNKKQ